MPIDAKRKNWNAMGSNSRSVSNLDCESSSRSRGTRFRTQNFSVETSPHTVGDAFGRPDRLSPVFDQRYTGNASADSPTGAMSIGASTLTETVHGALHQRDHRSSFFSDPYIHHQPTANSSAPIFETIGVSNRYDQACPHQTGFNTLGIITHMSGAPEKPHYSSPENYGRSYDGSDTTVSATSPAPRPASQQSASSSTLFDPVSGDITRGRHYSVDYGSVNPPPSQGTDEFPTSHGPEWLQNNTVTPGNYFDHYPHDHTRPLEPLNIPPRPLGEHMSPLLSEVFHRLDSSIAVDPGQPSSSVVKNVDESDTRFPVDEGQYTSGFRNPDYSSVTSTLDPRLHPQPPELSRKASRNSKTKIKTARRGSRTEKTQSPQRSSQRASQQIAFDSVPDTGGNIPGCHVLTPTLRETSHSGEVIASLTGIISESGKIEKGKAKRKPMDNEEKAAVKQNRIHGVCLRCKIYKEKCRGGFPCERCKALPTWLPICVTTQIVDKKVFSRGLYQAIYQKQRENVKECPTVAQKVSISNGLQPILQLQVKEYTPITEPSLRHTPIATKCNMGSGFTRIESTSFGVVNESIVMSDLNEYLDKFTPQLLNQLCGPDVDKIYRDTMNSAYEYHRNNNEGGAIILSALRMWTAQFVFFKQIWRITQSLEPLGHVNTLGMSAVTSPDLGLPGYIPLPHLLNSQLDFFVEKKIADLELQFLSGLQSLLFKKQPDEWFRIYLATFVFFSSLEEDTWNLETWKAALKSSETTTADTIIHWPLGTLPEQLIEKNEQLVELLSALFRGVSKGQAPFSLDWNKPEVQETAGREQAATEYMIATTIEVKRRTEILRERRNITFTSGNLKSLNMKFSSRLIIVAE